MTVTNCADIAEDLSLHAAGEPSLEVEAHLAVCAGCRQRHVELRAICGALHELREDVLGTAVPSRPRVTIDAPSRPAEDSGPCHLSDCSAWSWRRALWPLAIAASIAIALWPSAPNPPAPAPVAATWFALQRAALADEGALDRALAVQTAAFTATLHAAAQASPLSLAQLEP